MPPPSASNPRRARVCVLGSLNMDLIVRAPRLPTPGETLLGGEFLTLPGGKGANQAVAAARAGDGAGGGAGASVAMIGAVGDDDHGRRMLEVVSAEGVDVANIRRRTGTPTGIAVITVATEGGENTIVVAGGANQTLTPADVEHARPLLRESSVLLMQLESPLDAVAAAAALAHPPAITILNAAPAQPLPSSLLAQIDYLLVNRSEAAVLTGRRESDPPADLVAAALALGPRAVVLTLGAHGAIARVRSEPGVATFIAPSFRVEPIDTVAAGDAFAGTFAAALARQASFAAALTLASAAGALATTRRGAIPSLPTLAEITALAAAQPDRHARQE